MLLIKNGRVLGTPFDACDLLIDDEKIVEIGESIEATADTMVIDAAGLWVAPGLVDMHVHLREPGFEYKEDILTGSAAAAAGGVTTMCCMPNTAPVIDNAGAIRNILDRAIEAAVTVLPIGAVTMGQNGQELTNFFALKAAGAIALSDDGNSVQNARLAYLAMELAKDQDLLIISHCEDADLVQNNALNEGRVSRELGLPGRPAIAEELMVSRDTMLAAQTGAKLHIAHVSTANSVEIIRKAKEARVNVTAETCPQYFTLTEEEVLKQGPLARVNPPLRTQNDVEAIIFGLLDGTIDAIATDHAPHSVEEKARELTEAPSGMIGLETSLALALTQLYHSNMMSIEEIIKLMSTNPARILGIEAGEIQTGAIADIVIFDPDEEWTVDPEQFKSKARNSPFSGMELKGKVKYTISRGRVVFGN
ncbi:MAG: dihydroorotase [Oscillospiraceae bacterium]|nr:dihydroorotase [Oscillospiraceae bacterium]